MAPASKLGRGKPLKNQTKEVLHKIYKYFEKEIERDPQSTVTASQLVAHSTGISMNALKRVLSEYRSNAPIKKEYKKPKKRTKKVITSDDYEVQAIRRVIHSFYSRDEEFPIMKDLYLILKADIDYQGSLCTLRRHIAKLGFRWIETEDNNSILVDKQENRFARLQYLTKIDQYRSQGKNIVYTSDISIESTRISSRPKLDGTSTVLKQPAKSRLVLVLAGDQHGVLKNTQYVYDGNKKDIKEDTDSKKDNYDQIEKWYKYHLLPNLRPNSVVVIDSGLPYHNRVINPNPHSNSRKREIMDWLNIRNIPFSPDLFKPQLYQLVLLHKDKTLEYKTDGLLKENGHIVVRLPPHHPDLNPIRAVLNAVKDYVGTDASLSIDSVIKITKEKLASVSFEEWNQYSRFSEAEENNLKAIERALDDISERTFKNIDDESEGSDGDDENGTDQESMESD